MKQYEQKPLRYAMDALEPEMQKKTLEFHYGKHHAAYVANLNAALAKAPDFDPPLCPARLIRRLDRVPETIRTAVRNNGGGHFNHAFFWKCLAPASEGAPVGDLAAAISEAFGSFETFREKFSATAMAHFGAGWTWLILNKDGALAVCSTPNQDSPLMPESVVSGIEHGYPILALDLWEHAYYLQYQNLKADYVKSFWRLVNWSQAEKNYQHALEHRRTEMSGESPRHDACCCAGKKEAA